MGSVYSGIGRAVCQVLARDDARVVITDLDIQSCTRTEEEMTPGHHLSLAADVSQSEAVNECFQEVLERYKRPPDIIVNSAGITRTNSLLAMNEEDFEKVIDVNLKGTFLVTQTAASLMKENQLAGSIVNIASVVARTGLVTNANYTASKAGVIGFSKTAAKELGKFGIRVNVILPGFIKTPMTDMFPDKARIGLLRQIPLGDFGDPLDIAEVSSFLASSKSKYITGALLD